MEQCGNRRSIRLKNYDYSRAGMYFVTVCTHGRKNVLSTVSVGEVHLTAIGHIIPESWAWLCSQYEYVHLDDSIIMPNHIHSIITINACGGGSRTAPTKQKSLGSIMGAFKTVSTKRINMMLQSPRQAFWQRNYHEHIIRDEGELLGIRKYILHNPYRWAFDRDNPDGQPDTEETQFWHFERVLT
ncbi:MAG: transposase [Planctomycetota bacterium]